MALQVGDRLGRFEILGAIGAGGMGEVYRARDPHLQRDVAIKVLPAAYFDDADRRRRFEQEARAAGGLNHPNILAVFDIGTQGTSSYIVTELLAGETLRERMHERPLPAHKAVDFALQIASGVAAAHERGVVHRDLKPDNLFITTDGRVKILDFGLAKLVGLDPSDRTETVTIDTEDTKTATVLGTATYMSPEQARGLRVDHRTDVFSFGSVLYEMLTGFPPFKRATTADTVNAILNDEPTRLSAKDPEIAGLGPIVRHCLEKKPEERFQNFHDLSFHLRTRPQNVTVAKAPGSRAARRVLVAAAVLGAVIAAVAGGIWIAPWVFAPAPEPETHRVLPMTNAVGLEEFSALSPDGRMVAFTAAAPGGRRQVFVRHLSGGSGAPLPVTSDSADHQFPRWSPDGASIVYFSPAGPGEVQGTLYRVPFLGGASQRVIASIGGGDINSDGRVACFRLENDRIQLVTATLEGSEITKIVDLETQHYAYPRWSPDKKWIGYQAGDGFRSDVHVVASAGGSPKPLTDEHRVIRGLTWLPDSSGIIYASSRGTSFPYLPPMALWEVRLDGAPPRQRTPHEALYEQPDLHASGLMSVTRVQMRSDIWQYPFDRITTEVERGRQVTHQTGQVATPTVSKTTGEIAYLSDNGGHTNVWVTSKDGSTRRITSEDDPSVLIGLPSWSPDGKWLTYLSSKGNVGLDFSIRLVRADGSEDHLLVKYGLSPAWSEDSRWVYYVEKASTFIKRIPVEGGTSETVRNERARNIIDVYGSTVYYMVDRGLVDGRAEFEILAASIGPGPARRVAPIPGSSVPISWQVINPALSPDGKWLAIPLTDGFTTNVWAISTEDGRKKQVTAFHDRVLYMVRRLAWSVDGKSILAAVGEGDSDIVVLDGLFQGRRAEGKGQR
jgi:eukaryotic-like serine/threonine-protein kinase